MNGNAEARVSALIPARNEEANIERCVRSVAKQRGVREIIVVDDQSTDGTPKILESLKRDMPMLQSLRVASLPPGWLGKTYALAAAARLSTGPWLLFTDADTEHLTGSLEALLERAESERVDLLSVSPGQLTPTWWEKAALPRVYVELAKLFDFGRVSDPGSTAAAANGQYILIRRQAYQRVGGYEAARGEMLEDVALARLVKSSGGRLLFLPGSQWVRTRMYRTFPEMWHGWTKNLYLLYGRSLGKVLRAFAAACFRDLAPPFLFVTFSFVAAAARGSVVAALVALGVLLVAFQSHWAYRRSLAALGFDSSLGRYLIPGSALFALLLINSTSAYSWRGSVSWKGRAYRTRSIKESL